MGQKPNQIFDKSVELSGYQGWIQHWILKSLSLSLSFDKN